MSKIYPINVHLKESLCCRLPFYRATQIKKASAQFTRGQVPVIFNISSLISVNYEISKLPQCVNALEGLSRKIFCRDLPISPYFLKHTPTLKESKHIAVDFRLQLHLVGQHHDMFTTEIFFVRCFKPICRPEIVIIYPS